MSKISPWITAILSAAVMLYSFMNSFDKYIFGGALLILIVSIVMIIQEQK